MVEKINEVEMEVTIIPKLKACNLISLSSGDTIVIQIDDEKWDLDNAQEFYKLFEKNFPNNNIMVMFKGIDIGVIRENGKN